MRPAVACLPLLVLLAGCGGGSGGSTSSTSSSSGSGGGASAPAASAKVATLDVVGYGTVLATSGHPLYLLSSDPSGGSKCASACAKTWPPLTATGTATGGPGVKASLLSTFKRGDGSTQVLYDKHALYTHKGRGLVSGAGVSSYGGTWYLVSPSGKAIKATSSGGY